MSAAGLKTLAPGVHAWIGAGGDSNAGAIETPHGLLVVDAQQSQELGESLRAALTAATGMPIWALVNTHYHLDHVAGNAAFADVPIIGHEKTLAALTAELGSGQYGATAVTDPMAKIRLFFGSNFDDLVPEAERTWFLQRVGGSAPVTIVPPSIIFADRLEVRLPSDVARMEYWSPAHCDSDVVIWLENAGVIFLGDLCFHGRFPWFGDCDLDGWIRTLDRVLTMKVRIVIPGHGPPATLREVAQFRALLADLREAVRGALRAGLTEAAAAREIALPQYAGMPRYKEWMAYNVRSAYRYLCRR